MGIVSTKKANAIATNVTSTASINCYSKKVRNCYILDTALIVIILLLIITIICYRYKEKVKYKMENNEFQAIRIKIRKCYCLDDIVKLEDFDVDSILIDEKLNENLLIYDISYKTLLDPKSLYIRFDKIDEFIRIYYGTRYLIFLALKNMMLLTIELDIL